MARIKFPIPNGENLACQSSQLRNLMKARRLILLLVVLVTIPIFCYIIFPIPTELLFRQALWAATKPDNYNISIAEGGYDGRVTWDIDVSEASYDIISSSHANHHSVLAGHGFTVEGIFSLAWNECVRRTRSCVIYYDTEDHIIRGLAVSGRMLIGIDAFDP